jgi:AmmeMemoRadiSam system protein B
MMPSIREPVVAGAFYPGSRSALIAALTLLLKRKGYAEGALCEPMGFVVPHAGYIYSGAVAAAGYRELAAHGRPEWAIILGANHTGLGAPISIAREGIWRTPLGDAPIATEVADQLVAEGLTVADEAFLREHSIEVQLPFLQFLFGAEIPFIPICVMFPALSDLTTLGEAIAQVVRGKAGVVIASSDFTHYEPDETARSIDHRAIEKILALDVQGFHQSLIEERLSICGGGAIVALMACARRLGWDETKLLSYATSGDLTGERHSVVGYAAISLTGGKDG